MRGRTKQSTSTSPVERYIDWKNGAEGYGFYSYNKEREEEIKFDFTKLIIIDEAYQTMMWDNKERTFKRSTVISDPKEEMEMDGITFNKDNIPAGGKFLTLLTCLIDGELCRINLGKAAAYQLRSVFKDGDKWMPYNTRDLKYVEVTGKESAKAGNVEYEVPIFKLGGDITPEDAKEADKAADELEAYIESFNDDKD